MLLDLGSSSSNTFFSASRVRTIDEVCYHLQRLEHLSCASRSDRVLEILLRRKGCRPLS
jgi:hypothetical protein